MIAKEGKIILIPTSLILIIGVVAYFSLDSSFTWLQYVNYSVLSFLLFSLYFFREPNREIIDVSNQMLSPADGKVVQIIDIEDSEKIISIVVSTQHDDFGDEKLMQAQIEKDVKEILIPRIKNQLSKESKALFGDEKYPLWKSLDSN